MPDPAPISNSGKAAEERACAYLNTQGLQLLTRNYHCRRGEIDLVMRHGQYLVFIEVRYRRSARFGSAAESVDGRKQGRLLAAAQHYLQQHRVQTQPCRFDVVAITADRGDNSAIQWIQDAFQA